jgi:1,4-alpha-glucan branching enzyme
MAAGDLALVLHAHLPYVRSCEPGSLEQDWYFQALQECYLPLLTVLEEAAADPSQQPRLTLGLSPTLLSLLSDEALNRRFLPWIAQRRVVLATAPTELAVPASDLEARLASIERQWHAMGSHLLERFRRLQEAGVVDLITCAATHGYLPLLRDTPEAVRAQLLTAIREHQRLLGERPLGIWLPECAYFEGLDQVLAQCGLRYSLLDGHGLLHAIPRPRYGVYAPICSPAGVAFFGRDSESTLPVWSASQGYPGDGAYREFHRDMGWDLPEASLEEHGIRSRRPLGLKLYRVTAQGCPLERKEPYGPELAAERAGQHAALYLQGRAEQLHSLAGSIERPPLLVAPFDAELFGHWWFEGPMFIDHLLRKVCYDQDVFKTITPSEYLTQYPTQQLATPAASSWGANGYWEVWCEGSNTWIYPHLHAAAARMTEIARQYPEAYGMIDRALKQAARELLLAQSSDWAFIMKTGTMVPYAVKRTKDHLLRFNRLYEQIKANHVDEAFLANCEWRSPIFPNINWRYYL